MNFKMWMEAFDINRTELPGPWSKNIWVKQPNNQQQIDKWRKETHNKVYRMPVIEDKFIHFTLPAIASKILQEKKMTETAFAVSVTFGEWVPGTQFTHIFKRLEPEQQRNYAENIAAILFQTSVVPEQEAGGLSWNHHDEVIWRKDIPIFNAQLIPTRTAINILKHPKHHIREQDVVEYY